MPSKTKQSTRKSFTDTLPLQSLPFVVYGIRCPKTTQLVYVGITKDLPRRATAHYSRMDRQTVSSWVHTLKAEGLVPGFEILSECHDEATATLAKKALVSVFKPRFNGESATAYTGSQRPKDLVTFPNGVSVEQCLTGAQSGAFDPRTVDSLAVKKIKRACVERGIRLGTIANASGVTYQAIAQILNGKAEPHLRLALRLSQLFCVPVEDWLEVPEERKSK